MTRHNRRSLPEVGGDNLKSVNEIWGYERSVVTGSCTVRIFDSESHNDRQLRRRELDVLTSALEQFRDIIKEESAEQLEDIKVKLGLKALLRSKIMKREVSQTPQVLYFSLKIRIELTFQ